MLERIVRLSIRQRFAVLATALLLAALGLWLGIRAIRRSD